MRFETDSEAEREYRRLMQTRAENRNALLTPDSQIESLQRLLAERTAECAAMREALKTANSALRGFSKIEIPIGAGDGMHVATLYCGRQVTAFEVVRAREARKLIREVCDSTSAGADLLKRIAELEQDRERLNWRLRKQWVRIMATGSIDENRFECRDLSGDPQMPWRLGKLLGTGKTEREAIDAAISATSKGEKP